MSKPPKARLAAHKPSPVNTLVAQAKFHSGPLPAPQDLHHYEQISTGAANRIIMMAESQVAHRLSMERLQLESDIALRTQIHQAEDKKAKLFYFIEGLGQTFGWLLSLACVAGATYTSYLRAPWQVSVALVSLPVAAMIKAIRGSKQTDEKPRN